MNVCILQILIELIFLKELISKQTSASKECDICHYWYFLNKCFKFQANVWNRCHDLLIMVLNLSDVAILIIKHSSYCFIISGIRKSEAINVMRNTNLSDKSRTL